MSRWLRALIIAVAVLIVLIAIGSIMQHEEEVPATITPSATKPLSQCPVANTTYSFCFLKNGRAYYFAVEGWELPTIDEIKETLELHANDPDIKLNPGGLYVWLKIRTNLELNFGASGGSLVINEKLREIFPLTPLLLIKRGENEILIPYFYSPFSEAKSVHLFFETERYLDVLPTSGCFNGICFAKMNDKNVFYLYYTLPPAIFKVFTIKGYCPEYEYEDPLYKRKECLYNITFELNNGYMLLFYSATYSYSQRGEIAEFKFVGGGLNINFYVNRSGVLEPKGSLSFGIAYPHPHPHLLSRIARYLALPPTAINITLKKPGYEYGVIIVPPGIFTLMFANYGAVYPEPLFRGEVVYIGTPWGMVKLEPRLELVKVLDVITTSYEDGLVIRGVSVLLRNNGSIPIIVPQANSPSDIPEGYLMLEGEMDSMKLILVALDADGFYRGHEIGGPGVVINPGETLPVLLTPVIAENKTFSIRLGLEDLSKAHKLVVRSIYTNTSSELLIPPLNPIISVDAVGKLSLEQGSNKTGLFINLSILNNWIAPIRTDWVRVYLDGKLLSRSDYRVTQDEVRPGEKRNVVLEISVSKEFTDLYKKFEHITICLSLTCVDVPVRSLLTS